MTKVADLTAESVEALLGGETTAVLLDFWAPWCGRCRLLEPGVKAIAGDYEGRLRVARIDVATAPDLAERFGVQGLPTVLLLDAGTEVTRLEGVFAPAAIRSALDLYFAS